MKWFVVVAGLCCLGLCRAQSDRDTLVPGDFVFIPNHFYYDYGQDFLLWAHDTPPQIFSAEVYDRWGELVLETTDPHFNFDSFKEKKEQKYFGTYTLRLKFSMPGREEPFEVLKQLTYMGFYCTG